MYVPATPAPVAAPLEPVGLTSTAPAAVAGPAHTALRTRSYRLNVLSGERVTVAGTLLRDGRPGSLIVARSAARTGLPSEVVALQILRGRRWHTLARARTNAGGRFRLSYVPHELGSELARIEFVGDGADAPAHRRLGWLNVYREVEASWYGGGGSLACGGELTSSTLGVANRTLPCGTLVTFRYGGRTIRVPVIDRGPFVAGREYDLTEATKQALGFGDTGELWSTS